MKKREFTIPFSGLKQGKHEVNYVIENEFFESFGYADFNDAKLNLRVLLNKTSRRLLSEEHSSGLM